MTKLFDDNARTNCLSRFDFGELDYNNDPVSSMDVRKVSVKFAREFISTYHYTKTMPDSTKFVFAGFYSDRLAGVIVYGMGSSKNQYTALFPDIENGKYLELTRLWSPDDMPKNTESKLISESFKLLPKEIEVLMSFANPSQGHVGTIYQATNWHYCGMSSGGKQLITDDGIKKHSRLLGIYRMRHPEYENITNGELMDMYGYSYVESAGKHRYVYLLGNKKTKKKNFNKIKQYIQPYPKLDDK